MRFAMVGVLFMVLGKEISYRASDISSAVPSLASNLTMLESVCRYLQSASTFLLLIFLFVYYRAHLAFATVRTTHVLVYFCSCDGLCETFRFQLTSSLCCMCVVSVYASVCACVCVCVCMCVCVCVYGGRGQRIS
jgi:hypothetical protein